MRTRLGATRALSWLAVAALLGSMLSLVSASPAAADSTNLAYTDSCGGELEHACTVGTAFWGRFPDGGDGNGNFGCDRGLSEGIGSGICYNGSEPFARYTKAMDDYSASWTAWAADNQRRELAADEPINWVTTLSAHNGYNNRADAYNADPNQNYSLTDQLRGSVRWLDLDLVWFENQLRLCHGGGPGEKGVCSSYDRFYASAIKEIGAWLNWHPNDVILISYEDRFPIAGNDATSNDRVNNPITQYLDQNPNVPGAHRVYKPGDLSQVCADCPGGWPSQRQLLAAGKQVIIFDTNTRGDKYLWKDAQYPVYPASNADKIDYPNCSQQGSTTQLWQADRTLWSSVGEDRTYYGAQYSYAGLIENTRATELTGCNVTKIGLDMLHASQTTTPNTCGIAIQRESLTDPCPNPDIRVDNTIWSWREGDQGQYGNRALISGTDGRWGSAGGSLPYQFACAKPRLGVPAFWHDVLGADWRVTQAAGPWSDGVSACAAEFGAGGYVFAAPVNGWQNKQLLAKIGTSGRSVYLNYGRPGPVGTDWTMSHNTTTVSVPPGGVYDSTAKAATATVTGDNGLNETVPVSYRGRNGTTYGPTASPPTAPGDYTATATYLGDSTNLPSSASAPFTIGKASLTVKADDQSRPYATPNPPLTGTLTGVVTGDGITASYSTTAVHSSPPGDYPIVSALNDPNSKLGNYNVTSTNGTLRVIAPVGPPTITIATPADGQVLELGSTVIAHYVCSSPVGVVLCLGPVPSEAPVDTSSVGAKTFTVNALDTRFFSSSASVTYTVRDITTPAVSISTPADGATYAAGQDVQASYACTDLGLASCLGTVANGASIDTLTLGAKTFTVTGTDTTGNHTTTTVRYTVIPGAQATVTATSGGSQSTATGSTFINPLIATVTDTFGNPVPGVAVLFQVSSGSASFPGAVATASATTTAQGIATSPPLTAGRTAGPVVVTASGGPVSGANAAVYLETVTAPGPAKADLSVTLTAPSSAPAGGSITATLTVRNSGPNPSGRYGAALYIPRGFTATNTGGGTQYRSVVIFTGETLGAGRILSYLVTLKVDATAKGYPVFGAGALAATSDPNYRNNVAVLAVKII